MIHRLLYVGFLASLVATPAVAAPKKPAKGGLEWSLANASAYCERVVTRAPGTGMLVPSTGPAAFHDGTPPAMGTPDLVKRFAQTQPSGRLATGNPFYVNFITKGADVWAVVYQETSSCDVMVTAGAGDMAAVAARLTESLVKSGWQRAASSPAGGPGQLAQHVLTKKVPKADAPAAGVTLRLRALSGTAADPAGIQLDMSFLGDTLK
jgi:hypothetical protein